MYTAKVKASMDISAGKTDELASLNGSASIAHSKSYVDGAASGQIDAAITDDHTLGAAGTKTYDLDGAMTDLFGDAFAFSKIKSVCVSNTGENPLEVDGDVLGLSTDSVAVPAGGCFLLDLGDAGVDVTATDADELIITSALGTSYKLIVAGVK